MMRRIKNVLCLLLISTMLLPQAQIYNVLASHEEVHSLVDNVIEPANINVNQVSFAGRILFHYQEHGGATARSEPLNNFPITIEYAYFSTRGWRYEELHATTRADGSFNVSIPVPVDISSVYSEIYADVTIRANDGVSSYVVPSGALSANLFASSALAERKSMAYISALVAATNPVPSLNFYSVNFGDILIDPETSAAINIVRTIRRGYDFLNNIPGVSPPAQIPIICQDVQFPENFAAMYNFYTGYIYLSADPASGDAYNKSLILHEYGHAVMYDMIANSDTGFEWSSSWNFERFDLSPRLAFNEGWATFFGQSVLRDEWYIEGRPAWSTPRRYSLETPTASTPSALRRPITHNRPYTGSALFNAAVMWDIVDGINKTEIIPWATTGTWEDNVNRSFAELFSIVTDTLNAGSINWEIPHTAIPRGIEHLVPGMQRTHKVTTADLRRFYDIYFSHITPILSPNPIQSRDFYWVFHYNGMPFDEIPPEVKISSILRPAPGLIVVVGTATDNIKVSRLTLTLNGGSHSMNATAYNHNTGEFTFSINTNLLRRGNNTFEVSAWDYAGEYAYVIGGHNHNSPAPDSTPLSAASNTSQNSQWDKLIRRPAHGSAVGFYHFEEDGAPTNIAIVPGLWDDIGSVLTSMGIPFDSISAANLSNYNVLSQYDIVFVNCETQPNSTIARQFVQNGGILYVSDLSGFGLTGGFPNLSFTQIPDPQTINTSIVDTGLATYLGRNNLQVTFNLDHWAIATRIPSDSTVYVQSEYLYINGNRVTSRQPLAFSFRHGEGRVFYTSFHNNAQATGDMMQFLEYLIFNIQHSHNEDNLVNAAEPHGYNYEGALFGRLASGETSNYFSITPTPAHDFKLLMDSSMGNFDLKLVDPLGRAFYNNQFGIIAHRDYVTPQEIEANNSTPARKLDFEILEQENNSERRSYFADQAEKFDFSTSEAVEEFPSVNEAFDFSEFDGADMTIVSMGHQGFVIENPILGEWHFAVTSNNPVDDMVFMVGIAEKPQAPIITNTTELLMLNNGNGVTAQGVSPATGRIEWTLLDSAQEEITKGNVNANAGGNFAINLPALQDANFILRAKVVDRNGMSSDYVTAGIMVSSAAPKIFIDERYEMFIFGETVYLVASATDAIFAWVELNGEVIESQIINGSGTGASSVGIFTNLELIEGINEVTVSAINSAGVITEETVFITSDQTTPAEFRTSPTISNISIEQDAEISEFTIVTIEVEDDFPSEIFLSVANNHTPVNVTNKGNGVFEFSIDPAAFHSGARSIRITAENRWGNHHQVMRQIFIIGTPEPLYDLWCAETIYTGGERVMYNGLRYEARWWTLGDRPDGHNTESPWLFIGDEVLPWRADIGYRVGTQVNYNGRIYEALSFWINAGVVPGSDEFHWIFIGYADSTAYRVTVISEGANHAIGSGNYTAGEIVNIFAGIRPGFTFTNWTASPTANFVNSLAPFTSFNMPPYDLTVTANKTPVVIHRGDVNGDGIVDEADVALLIRFLLASDRIAFRAANPEFIYENADLNGDGTVNATDLTILRLLLNFQ
jgi:chitodextrinase